MSPLKKLVHDYQYIHLGIGLVGNVCFVIGSVLYLKEQGSPSAWLFVTGSTGMLVGSIGSAAVSLYRAEESRRRDRR